MSLSEYDFINLDFPYLEGQRREEIYYCFREPPLLTVTIGAKCSHGMVLIADRKVSTVSGRKLRFEEKIRGDLAHLLIGYAGRVSMFDIFRKYIVGDVVIRRSEDPYTHENFIDESARSVKRFNALLCEEDYLFEVLIAKHLRRNSELYHIDVNGTPREIKHYKAIGSGADTADKFCGGLSYDTITMKDFTKRAFFAIVYMDQHHPETRVGIKEGGIPLIKYMDYKEEWDEEIKQSHSAIDECRNYTNERMEKLKQGFQEILRE